MALYIKKPVMVEALQWDGSWDRKLIIEALWPSLLTTYTTIDTPTKTIYDWWIDTGGHSTSVEAGDYIVKHRNGDFEVVDADSFNEMYESVE